MIREARGHGGKDQPAGADNLLAGRDHGGAVADMFEHVRDQQRAETASLQSRRERTDP